MLNQRPAGIMLEPYLVYLCIVLVFSVNALCAPSNSLDSPIRRFRKCHAGLILGHNFYLGHAQLL